MKILMNEVADTGSGGGGGDGEVAQEGGTAAAPPPSGGAAGAPDAKAPRDDGRDDKGRFARKDGEPEPEKKAPPPKVLRKVQVKFKGKDGKEIVQEDEVDEDQLVRSHQVARGLRMKAEEWAKEREERDRKIAELEERLQRGVREDSRFILPEDVNPIEYHSAQLERLLAEHAQDPKDRQIAQLRSQLEERERREQEREQQQQEAAERAEAVRIVEHIRSKVVPLIEKAGLPQNDLGLERAVKHYYSALRQGIEDPDPEIIAEEVVGEFAGTLESVAEKLDGERALRLFPKLSFKIAAALRDRYKAKATAKAGPAPQKTDAERRAERERAGVEKPPPAERPRLLNDREMDKLLGIRP